MGFVRRPDLDWVVRDNPDGSITKLTPDHGSDDPTPDTPDVSLIGYSWDAASPVE